MKNETDYGYEFAAQNSSDEGFDGPVDIDEILTGTVDIPNDDYLFMQANGIAEPDARKYWNGFNSYFE